MILQTRKKAFSHKVRSGCDTCKKRHLKCDEGKPVCQRCVRVRFECRYNVPKALLFELKREQKDEENWEEGEEGHDGDVRTSEPRCLQGRTRCLETAALPLVPSMSSQFGSWREQHALKYWVTETGPWLANYLPRPYGTLLERIMPRCAASLPATRHLLIAVAMLDQRYHGIEPPEMLTRTQHILGHYNKALKALMSPKVEQLDLYLSPLLAWSLEVMVNNISTAMMHLKALSRMLANFTLPRQPNESQDIISEFLFDTTTCCIGYTSTAAMCANISPTSTSASLASSSSKSIFWILNNRQATSPDLTTSEHIRQAIYEFCRVNLNENDDNDTDTEFKLISSTYQNALFHLRNLELSLLERRFTGTEPGEVIIATHFLVATVTALVAKSSGRVSDDDTGCEGRETVDDESDADDEVIQRQAFDYLLMKMEDLVTQYERHHQHNQGQQSILLQKHDRGGLEDALTHALHLIEKFVSDRNHREWATRLRLRL